MRRTVAHRGNGVRSCAYPWPIPTGSPNIYQRWDTTGKTSIGIILTRAVNTYITNSGSEIDNSAALSADWQATYKTGVAISYVWDYAELPGQRNRPFGSYRLDHIQTLSATITYQALRWLAIKPFANYRTRSSSYLGGNYDAWVLGVSLSLQWPSM